MIKDNADHRKLFEYCCPGDKDAVEFLLMLARIFRVWDDIVDEDRAHTKDEIDKCFEELMFGVDENKFYQKHKETLDTFIAIGWNAWKDHNTTSDKTLNVVLNDICDEIVLAVAFLSGGIANLRRVSMDVRNKLLVEEVLNRIMPKAGA